METAPAQPEGWATWFEEKARELQICDGFNYAGPDSNGMDTQVERSALSSFVEALDAAIEYANDMYESDNLPRIREEQHQRELAAKAALQLQSDLDELAAKFAKPNG